jgi:predicted transcriptional regulator
MLARHLRQPPRTETTVLISVKPHYVRLIETGEKRVEFRRRFPREVGGGRAIFYVTTPVRRIEMVARITGVVRATPAALWRAFGEIGGTTRAAFDAYFAGARVGVALVLEEVRVLRPGIGLADPRLRAAGFRPPQSAMVLAAGSGVGELVDRCRTVRAGKGQAGLHGTV